MNYQPFPREAHFTAVDGNWTATIWFPAAVRHTSNKCSSRVPNINMCNPCANGHKSTPPPLPGLKTTGGRELKVEPAHAASATRTAHCSVGAEPSELRASNAARLSSCPCIQSIPNLSVWRDCAPKWRPFTCSTSLRLVCSCCTQMGAIWAYDHATH